jgi:hypothetical protein
MALLRGGGEKLLAWFFGGGAVGVLSPRSATALMMDAMSLYGGFRDPRSNEREITARPTKKKQSDPYWSPDEEQLLRLGRATRELRRVEARDPFAAVILEALFSDAAARFARTKWGRTAALLPLTETGKKLMSKARAKQRGAAALKIDDAKLAENIVQGPTADFTRSILIKKALDEADELETYACAVYNGDDVPPLGVVAKVAAE